MSKNALFSTTFSLIALQLGSRLFSFGLNQSLLRSTTPIAFGVATIQFDTLRDTTLFLLREGIRGAIVRTRSNNDEKDTILRRQSRLIPTLLSPLIIPIFFTFSYYSSPTSSSSLSPYHQTLLLYALSTLIELLSEPSYLQTLTSWETLTHKRVKIEGIALVSKALTTLTVLKVFQGPEEDALLAYGWGQVTYSLTLFVGLRWIVKKKKKEEDRKEDTTNWKITKVIDDSTEKGEGVKSHRYFDPEITKLGWILTRQSLVKQVLTEGDKLAVSKFGKGEDLAGYAVALNYGSLIARILFQPLEESSRLYFSSLAKTNKSKDRQPSSQTPSTPSPSSSSLRQEEEDLHNLSLIASHLSLILTFYTHLTLILTLLVPSYISPLLRLLLGSKWSQTNAGDVLKLYVMSLPLMAFNGILESGFASLADERWIKRSSYWLIVCTFGFVVTIELTMGNRVVGGGVNGSGGLILANCVNMALRILFATRFSHEYFSTHLVVNPQNQSVQNQDQDQQKQKKVEEIWNQLNWKRWMPSFMTILSFIIGGRIVRSSEQQWIHSIDRIDRGLSVEEEEGGELRLLGNHLLVGIVVGVSCLSVLAATKKTEIQTFIETFKRQKKNRQDQTKVSSTETINDSLVKKKE